MTNAQPPAPPAAIPATGLTSREAQSRAQRGLANIDTTKQRTDGDVIRDNVFTFFNVVLGVLIAALFALAIVDLDIGHFQDGMFVGIVVAMNVVVSTFQEIRAMRTLRDLQAITAPRTTVIRDGREESLRSEEVVQGDLLLLRPGDQVVADGHVVANAADIDESLLTGESTSIRKAAGDELLSGSFCTGGHCYYTAERVGTQAYALRLTADARELVKRATPLQLRFHQVLRVLLIATGILAALLLISFNVEDRGFAESIKATTATVTTVVPVGLLLGMTVAFAVGAVRVSRANAIVQDIDAVEALNYVDIICLDKTGTITANRLTMAGVEWAQGAERDDGWLGAFAAATSAENRTAAAVAEGAARTNGAIPLDGVPFNSERRWSAVTLRLGDDKRHFVMGAPETLLPACLDGDELRTAYEDASRRGLRGVIFAEARTLPNPERTLAQLRPLALIAIADVLRKEVKSAFTMMRQLGIEPKLISGDNPATVAALVAQLELDMKGGAISGTELARLDAAAFARAVDEYSIFGRVAPAQKSEIVRALQAQGHFVAMVGDGANDVHALRAADVAVAMESGTGTARGVAGIILRNDSFEALIRGVKEAQAVLGNTARLSKLFLTKSVYAYVVIVATNMLGLDFPFLPRHGSLTALLTLGIPAIFISISVPPPESGRDFTRNVLRFALPASLSLGIAAIAVHLISQGLLNQPVEEARTLVSMVIGITGLVYMVEVLGFEGASWRNITRPVLTTILGAILVAGFLLTLYTEWLRRFFDFTEMGVAQWALVAPAVLAAIVGQFVISRWWQQIIDFATARGVTSGIERGRSV